jgi:hypothetical protein
MVSEFSSSFIIFSVDDCPDDRFFFLVFVMRENDLIASATGIVMRSYSGRIRSEKPARIRGYHRSNPERVQTRDPGQYFRECTRIYGCIRMVMPERWLRAHQVRENTRYLSAS